MVGAFVLTDSLGRTFTDLFATVNKNIAVDVRGAEMTAGPGDSRRRRPARTCRPARWRPCSAVDGVAEVQGNVVSAEFNQVSVLGKDGKALTTNGAPIIAGNWIDSAALNQQRVVDGTAAARTRPRSCSTASWPRRPA